MARKKKTTKKVVSRKFGCEKHEWRDWTWTHSGWYGVGRAYKIHRSCYRCALIEWAHTIPAQNDSEDGRKQVLAWISERKC